MSSETIICQGSTTSGKKCTRDSSKKTATNHSYCWQHQTQAPKVPITAKAVVPKEKIGMKELIPSKPESVQTKTEEILNKQEEIPNKQEEIPIPGTQAPIQNQSEKVMVTSTQEPQVSESKNPLPLSLLEEFAVSVNDLIDHKNLPYDEFIATMMEISNEVTDPEAMMITPDMMDTIDYPQSDLIIEIMNDDGEGIPEQKLLHNQGGFTKGQLLYQLAQVLPEVDYGDHHFFEGLRRYSEDAIYEVLLGS